LQESFASLLDSLEKIVDKESGADLDDEIVCKIFNEFPYLESADYEGKSIKIAVLVDSNYNILFWGKIW
jgi:hypothetical protein